MRKIKALIYNLKWKIYRFIFGLSEIPDDYERKCEMCEDKKCKTCSEEDYSG